MVAEICQGCGALDEIRIIVEGERLCAYCRGVWIEWEADFASAGEAGTAETTKIGSVHEHAVGVAETPGSQFSQSGYIS